MSRIDLELSARTDESKDREEQLLEAIERLSYGDIFRLLGTGMDVNFKGDNGKYPIHIACQYGGGYGGELCRCLILKGASVNVKDQDGNYPLELALREGNLHVLNWFLDDMEYSDSAFESEEHSKLVLPSVSLGQAQLCKALQDSESEMISVLKNGGTTLLHTAIVMNHYHIVSCILKNCSELKEIVRDSLKRTVKQKAISFNEGSVDNVARVINGDDKLFPVLIMRVIESGYIEFFNELIEDLVECGLDLNIEIKDEGDVTTFLHESVKKGQLEMMETLLRLGAYVDALDERNKGGQKLKNSPLLWVCGPNSCDVDEYDTPDFNGVMGQIMCLLKWGADVNLEGSWGSALLNASCYGNIDMVRFLLTSGADPYFEEPNGSILSTAIEAKKLEIIELILQSCWSCPPAKSKLINTLFETVEEPAEVAKIRCKYQTILTCLYKHAYNLELPRPDSLITPDNKKLISDCEKEITKMKNHHFGNAIFSLLDILACGVDQLAGYMRNEDFASVIKTTVWRDEYPNYEAMIGVKLSIGEERRKILDGAQSVLHEFLPPILPQVYFDMLLRYFSSGELRKLICVADLNRNHKTV